MSEHSSHNQHDAEGLGQLSLRGSSLVRRLPNALAVQQDGWLNLL